MKIQNIGLNATSFQQKRNIEEPKANKTISKPNFDIERELEQIADINKALISNNKNVDKYKINLTESKNINKTEVQDPENCTIKKLLKDGSQVQITYKDGKVISSTRTKSTPDRYEEEVREYVYDNGKLRKVVIERETQIIKTVDGTKTHPFAYTEQIETEKQGETIVTRHNTTRTDNNTQEETKTFVERKQTRAQDGTILRFYTQEKGDKKVKILDFETQDGIKGRYDFAKNQVQEVVFPQDKRGVRIKITRVDGQDNEFIREVRREQGISALEHWKNDELIDVKKKHATGCKTRQILDHTGHVSVQYCNSDWDRVYADATLDSRTRHVPNYPLSMPISENIKLYEGYVEKVVDSVN